MRDASRTRSKSALITPERPALVNVLGDRLTRKSQPVLLDAHGNPAPKASTARNRKRCGLKQRARGALRRAAGLILVATSLILPSKAHADHLGREPRLFQRRAFAMQRDALERQRDLRAMRGGLGGIGLSKASGRAGARLPETAVSQGSVVLECDWTRLGGSALGRTNAQITDNNFWSLTGGDESSGSEIVTASSAGMPGSGNALKLRVSDAGNSPLLHKTGLGTISASGGTRNYRWSFLFEQTYTGDRQEHPIQDGPNYGDSSWAFHSNLLSGETTWNAHIRPNTGSGENPFSLSQWGLVLTVGVVYQFEFQIHRTATNDFNLHGRVYDAAGSVIKTDADFTNAEVSGSPTSLATNPTLHFVTVIGADTLDELVIGSEGLTPSPGAGAPYAHEGGFEVRDGLTAGSGWIGPVT